MAENTVTEAALHLVQSFREANQAVAESIVASQERNVKFAQSIFTSGAEILKSHVEGTQALVQKIEQQTQQQQEAFQSLLQALGQDMGPEIGQQMQKQQETFRRLVRELEQQTHQQQEAFQKLVQAAMEASKNLLYTPLSYYQQSTDATETISSI
jgi:DUF438 domain-containing protein